ncbi:UNVERIFIED_CONTAM: hypothetical protein GTU68_024345 [Idotea baltica]|nr:hypothetical protein [Idotea baltica]
MTRVKIKQKHLKNFINGQFLDAQSGQWIDNYKPATGEVYCFIPDSDERDVDTAVQAAQQAFPNWSTLGIEKRSRILTRIADLIEQNLDLLAEAESEDNGKPFTLASNIDIPRAASNFRFFASAINHFASESHFMEGEAINYTLRRPIGVVGCISPWNLPLYLFTWKIAPALAAGNCVVAKPSEITPRTAFLLSMICETAGLPEGVLNIVHGYGPKVGQAIVDHSEIKAISFTGGTITGSKIAASAAPKFKKLSLELGGKNPALVFEDANIDKVTTELTRASFANQGQICLCSSRILVHEKIYDAFITSFIEKVKALRVGDPKEESSEQGALVSEEHMHKVLDHIDIAIKEGATVLCGGEQVKLNGRCANGWFVAPTVLVGLNHMCKTNQEEIFGPVVTVMPFSDDEDAILKANATKYGLAATIWTQNLNKAHYVAEQIEAGIVWINCWMVRDLRTPFGGQKHSGVGREGGLEALRFFTEVKNVCLKI